MTPTETPDELDLTPEIQGLVREYSSALMQVRLKKADLTEEIEQLNTRRAGLKEEFQKFNRALEEVENNIHGTVRSIVRMNKLDGNWRPNDDGTKLIRSN